MREDETEGTQVEDLDAQIAALKAKKHDQKAIQEQRKMLPALDKKIAVEMEIIQCHTELMKAAEQARREIKAGKLTEYRLRARPVRRAKKEQAE